jgi:hypothetical protein
MKRCPKCNRTYDDSLSFCLEDGAVLAPSVESETVLLHHPKRRRIWLLVAVVAVVIFGGIGIGSLILIKGLSATSQRKTVTPQKRSFPQHSPDAAPAAAESSPELDSDHDSNLEISEDASHQRLDDPNIINAEDTTFEDPLEIRSPSITLRLRGNNKEEFFALNADKEVAITFELKAEATNAGANIAFLDNKGNDLVPPVLIQAIDREAVHESVKVKLPEHSKLIMKVASIAYGSETTYPGILKVSFEPSISE